MSDDYILDLEEYRDTVELKNYRIKIPKEIFDLKLEYDEFGAVVNHEKNYVGIASCLVTGKSFFVAYHDKYNHYDVFLKYCADIGNRGYQFGLTQYELFVGVVRVGFFGFSLKEHETYASYYDEKFGRSLGQDFYDFLNGIRKALWKQGESNENN